MDEQNSKKLVGRIIHYYEKISVGIIELSDNLSVGDEILIKGATTEFAQPVSSMEFDHQEIKKGQPGMQIGIKVANRVRVGDQIYKNL